MGKSKQSQILRGIMEGNAVIALTSKHAARSLCAAASRLAADEAKVAHSTPVFTIGDKSHKKLSENGFCRLLGADTCNAMELAELIQQDYAKDKPSVIFLCGDKALPTLPTTLLEAGFNVVCEQAYSTRIIEQDIIQHCASSYLRDFGMPAAIVAFSPSGVPSLKHLCTNTCNGIQRIAIGTTTAAAMNSAGLPAHAIASNPSPSGVLEAVRSLLQKGDHRRQSQSPPARSRTEQ